MSLIELNKQIGILTLFNWIRLKYTLKIYFIRNEKYGWNYAAHKVNVIVSHALSIISCRWAINSLLNFSLKTFVSQFPYLSETSDHLLFFGN